MQCIFNDANFNELLCCSFRLSSSSQQIHFITSRTAKKAEMGQIGSSQLEKVICRRKLEDKECFTTKNLETKS